MEHLIPDLRDRVLSLLGGVSRVFLRRTCRALAVSVAPHTKFTSDIYSSLADEDMERVQYHSEEFKREFSLRSQIAVICLYRNSCPLIAATAAQCSLEIISYLLTLLSEGEKTVLLISVLRGAATRGDLSTVKYCETLGKDWHPCVWNSAAVYAARAGENEIVAHLKQHHELDQLEVTEGAARGGNLALVKEYRDNGSEWQEFADQAAAGGHLEVLSLCMERGRISIAQSVIVALEGGHTHIAEYYSNNIPWDVLKEFHALTWHLRDTRLYLDPESPISYLRLSTYLRWRDLPRSVRERAAVGEVD